MKQYTIKQAADALGSSKSTVRRLLDRLPPEYISAGEYRGHTSMLISQAGFDAIRSMLGASEPPQESNPEADQIDSSAPGAAGGSVEASEAGAAALISALQDRIASQERQITSLSVALESAQNALNASQALHAATVEQLRLLTAGTQDSPPERQTEPELDDEPVSEGPAASPGAPSPEKSSFWSRLRYVFSGK